MRPALIWNFTRKELVDRYAGSSLGFAWAFIKPLVLLFIFVVIFGGIMGARLPGVEGGWAYSIYLVSGMLPWLAFSSTLMRTATVFVDKQHLLSKVGLSLPVLPLFIVLAETVTFIIAFGLFTVLLLAIDHPWRVEALALPLVFAVQQALALGIGLFLAALNVFLRDVREFVGVLTQLWFWLTPIVWVSSIVDTGLYSTLYRLNPLLPLTEAYHAMFIGDATLPVDGLAFGHVPGIGVAGPWLVYGALAGAGNPGHPMIEAENVCKQFRLYRRPIDRVKERLFRRSFHHVHRALEDISFSVAPGKTLGIIGHNGAGKSTLLKLLNGVLLPDSGRIHAGGRITGLLELGTGFNVELSGLANIANNGLLIGMDRDEIAARRDDIIAFSELGDFIHEPLRTYSSGMVMRLGFAIAIHAQPDTFLVDEALAVGDAHFQQKCFRAIRAFREAGGSILLVSHDLNAIKRLSDQVLLLDHGRMFELGEPETVVNSYNFLVARQGDADVIMQTESKREGEDGTDYGDGRAQIRSLSITGCASRASTVSAGEATRIAVRYVVHEPLPELTVGILVRDRFGQDIFGTNTFQLGVLAPSEAGEWLLEFAVDMAIAPGRYSLTVALHSQENHLDACHHWRDLGGGFEVAGVHGPRFSGICRLPTTVQSAPSQGET